MYGVTFLVLFGLGKESVLSDIAQGIISLKFQEAKSLILFSTHSFTHSSKNSYFVEKESSSIVGVARFGRCGWFWHLTHYRCQGQALLWEQKRYEIRHVEETIT